MDQLDRCGVAIAGLAVLLISADQPLIQALRQRYHDFPAPMPIALTATITLTGTLRKLPTLDQGLSFEHGVAHCCAPGFTGWIDVQAGRAELQLSSRFPVEDSDYFVRMLFALLLFEQGGLVFHAAGIERHGRGYAFWGHSGSGKTTVARLAAGDRVLNDDLVVLLPEADRWRLHATPFWNPTQIRSTGPHSSPLQAMFRLVQAPQVALKPMSPAQSIAELVASVPIIPLDPQRIPRLISLAQRIWACIPTSQLLFRPDNSFWHLIDQDED